MIREMTAGSSVSTRSARPETTNPSSASVGTRTARVNSPGAAALYQGRSLSQKCSPMQPWTQDTIMTML